MRKYEIARAVGILMLVTNDATWATPQFFPGTGHYYEVITNLSGIAWSAAKTEAEAQVWYGQPGYLACIATAEENEFVFNLTLDTAIWHPSTIWYIGPWLGGFQQEGAIEPGDGWTWVDDETWSYANWLDGQPDNNDPVGNENRLVFWGYEQISPTWNDYIDSPPPYQGSPVYGYVVEFDGPAVSVQGSTWGSLKAAYR